MFEIIYIIIIIIPVAISIGGFFLKYHMTSDINDTIGYRTEKSMSSKEAWVFANKSCGKLWLAGGIIAFIVSVSLPLLFYTMNGESVGSYVGIVILILQLIAVILSIVKVEKQLDRNFDNKKQQGS